MTYEELKPHLTNKLWTEDDATRNTEGHECARHAWRQLFGVEMPGVSKELFRLDCGDNRFVFYPEGRVHRWMSDADEIYQLSPESGVVLGLATATDFEIPGQQDLATENRRRVQAMMDDKPPYTEEELRTGELAEKTPASRYEDLLSYIQNPWLVATCRSISFVPEFKAWPASISHHHAYEGGLLTHTVEVAELAVAFSIQFPQCDLDVLIAAALWHDFGKTLEYELQDWTHPNALNPVQRQRHLVRNDDATGLNVWITTEYQKRIGHIAGGAAEFAAMAAQHDVDPEVIAKVMHCILSHHGPVREWGSPVAPQSLEALLLHQADMLSAHYGATK